MEVFDVALWLFYIVLTIMGHLNEGCPTQVLEIDHPATFRWIVLITAQSNVGPVTRSLQG